MGFCAIPTSNLNRRAVRTCSLRGSACAESKAKSPPPGGNRRTSRPHLALRGTRSTPTCKWWGVVPSLPKGCAFLGLGPICTGCRGPWRPGSKRGKTRRPRGAQEGNEAACRARAAARAAPPLLGRGIISPALSSHPRTTWHNIFYLVAEAARFRFLFVEQALLASVRRQVFWDRWADFLREGSRSHLRNGFVQPLAKRALRANTRDEMLLASVWRPPRIHCSCSVL